VAQIKITTPDIPKILRGSRATLDAVVRGDVNALLAVGNVFVTTMREGIRAPNKTGRMYSYEFRMVGGKARGKRKGKGRMRPVEIKKLPRPPHQASAPGEFPAWDTGNLGNSIQTAVTRDSKRITKVGVGVLKGAKYWKWLEKGTRFMEPRPFVRRAQRLAISGAHEKFIKEMRALTKKKLRALRKKAGK
jgi:HK97 gp10 family phage protein